MSEHSEKQIDVIATGVAKLHERLDVVDKRLDRHDQLFIKIVDRLDSLGVTVKDTNLKIDSFAKVQASTDRELIDHDKRITALESKT